VTLRLTITEGPDYGRGFQVPMDEPQLLGRSSEALPITDTTVSRRHAELTPDNGRWYIRDLQSQNHTYVNGVQIEGRTEIHAGDEIRVGSTVLRVGDAFDDAGRVIRFLGNERLDSEIEHRIPSNEDSIILAEPEPSRAAVEHLRVIYRLTALTSQVGDQQELLRAILDLVFSVFEPERGVIVLLERGGPDGEQAHAASGDMNLRPACVKYKHAPTGGHEGALGEDGIEVSRTIVQTCIREGEGILSSNAQADPRFRAGDSVARYNIRSAICSPIRFQSRTFGAIYIDSSIANYTFTVEQLALMNAVGLHTALALANAEQTARRLHAERLAAMGETIASLSHSIKNILQGLRGGADVLEMGLDRADHKIARGGWDILKRNLDRIVGLTMNMLTYSRQRHVELEVTRLDRLIEDCQQLLDPLCESRGVALIVDAEPDVPPIAVDPSLIHQALMNLLTNAVEAVPPETGAVTVRLEYREAGPANPDVQRDCAEISVTDNGPGIPRDQLSWIFEPFNTTKGIKGTGLGLAVTRRILQDHRGRVRVETSEGKGSTFRLRIPADLDSASDPSETTEQLPPSGDLLRRL